MEKQTPQTFQTEFLEVLFRKEPVVPDKQPQQEQNKRRVLPPNQRAGFRDEYNKAVITLTIVAELFDTAERRKYMPEEIKHEEEKAQKTKDRYERYKPKASQKITHFGKEVVRAYMSPDGSYMSELEEEARRSKYPDKRRVCAFVRSTVDRMGDIIRLYNEII